MSDIKLISRGLLILFIGVIQLSDKTSEAAETCEPSGNLSYVCGPRNAEDILQLGDSDWLITSGMDGQMTRTDEPGHIYLVNHRDKTYMTFFPGDKPVFKQDLEMFGNCPGPINPDKFSAHGLALQQQPDGNYRLYITSHGEREAIEVFEINAGGDVPAISWVGCVLLPEKVWANSVAILSDGGFVTTKFMDPSVPNAFGEIFQGKVTGEVYAWHPGAAVQPIPGTQLSAPNGIAVSEDNRWLYVNAFGTREVVRYDLTAVPVTKQSVAVSVTPDNIRWGDDGLLYVVGGNYVPPADCASPPCRTGWSVLSVDPQTMVVNRVTGVDQTATLQGASAAVPVGNEIWIGTYAGDRVGYLPRP